MDNEPTEARQDELAGIREQLFNLLLEAYGSTKSEHHPNVMQYRILDSLTVSSGGGKCNNPICINGKIDTALRRGKCLWCNGTGRKPIVTKAVAQCIEEATKDG